MKKFLATFALLAGLVSCVETNNKLGSNLVATNQQFDFFTTELDLTEVQSRSIDSLSGYSSSAISIGSIRDKEYGLYTRGCAVTLVPVLDSVDFGKNPVFKRFKFQAAPDSVSVSDLNQMNILQNVNVYPLTEPLDTKQYFSRAKVNYSNTRITKGVPVIGGADSLAFDFTEAFGKQYLNITQSDMEDFDAYTKKFPGIYICTDDPLGEGGRINKFGMNILTTSTTGVSRTDNYAMLYFNGEFNGERRDSALMFYFSPLQFQDLDSLINVSTIPSQYVFNVDSHETDHLQGKAEDKIYIEGGSGLKPVFPASEIRNLVTQEVAKHGGDINTALITKATIVLPFDFPDNYKDLFRFPQMLSPTVRIKTDTTVTFAGLTDASASSENQGDMNRSTCCYTPDISFHVQQLMREKDLSKLSNYDIWMLIMAYETTTTVNSEASEMADYYNQLAYYSYYSQLYGGGYGSYGSSYGSGYGSSYSNYYNYMMMAQYASSSASTTSSNLTIDKDGYYNASLHGPTSTGKRPSIKLTIAIPKK